MKNVFRIFSAVVAGMVLFVSCLNEAAPLASTVSVDRSEFTIEAKDASPVTLSVTSDGDWFVMTPNEWITVEPANGGEGTTEVTIKFADNVDSYNELGGPRSGSVYFCYGSAGSAAVSVSQNGEAGLDASRTYTLVTTQEDITAGNYLVVFKNADKYLALTPLNGSYGYLYTSEVSPVEDVITMPNSKMAYTLATSAVTEGAYTLSMSNGKYLYMSGTYNTFNASATAPTDNSGDFALAIGEESTEVTITNVAKTKYMQYSTTYGSAGAYSSAQDGALMPCLYKDSKVTDEVLSVPETITVLNTATSVTISVSSNKTWKVRNHDEWIKTFTPSGEGNGAIEITFDAYESETENRTAEFLVIGETTNYTVVLTQVKAPTTIAEIYPQITSTNSDDKSSFSVNLKIPAVVAYVNGKNAFIEDETGGILFYSNNQTLKVGQKISGVLEGTGYKYNGVSQIAEITSDGHKIEDGTAHEPTKVTIKELLADYDRYVSCVVKIEGVTITEGFTNDDRSGVMKQEDKTINVYVQDRNADPEFGVVAETEGDIVCIPTYYKTTKQVGIWESAHFVVNNETTDAE